MKLQDLTERELMALLLHHGSTLQSAGCYKTNEPVYQAVERITAITALMQEREAASIGGKVFVDPDGNVSTA